ncbi:hypothetical protein QBC41DRAFT_397965 [Cercophora samala]|uniref:Uncharacterized protein n=1 Tax=Cercophora samala TaxID=330535 RepID=A0AA40D9A5_9PEZI|nr:hypothetical protein QBC41DRAFT_397965 [Cercophora samala]
MPHFRLVVVTSSDGQGREYVFCDLCLLREQNRDPTGSYCSLHRPVHSQPQDASYLRDDQVEGAIQTTLLAAYEASQDDDVYPANKTSPLVPTHAAESPQSSWSSSSTEEEDSDNKPTKPLPSPTTANQSEAAQQPPLPQAVSSISQSIQTRRRGPGRRAENLRIHLANPPPLPNPGERPNPEVLARHGVIVPNLPTIPGLRPSKQPGVTAIDLAWCKAHRLCSNCHKPVDDLNFSKCTSCRAAGLERAKRYQAKKKELEKEKEKQKQKEKEKQKGKEMPVQTQTIAGPSRDGTYPETQTTVSLHRAHATTRDRIYMALIDRLQLHRRHPTSQNLLLGPGREQDVYLDALDMLTDIRLSRSSQLEHPPLCPATAEPENTTTTTTTTCTEQQPPNRRTPPREEQQPRYLYSTDYFAPDDDPRTPKGFASRWAPTTSASLPTPTRSSPFGRRRSQPSQEPEQEEHRLHPLLVGIPPEEWSSLPSSSLSGMEVHHPFMAVQVGGYPVPEDSLLLAAERGRYDGYYSGANHHRRQGSMGDGQDFGRDCPFRYHLGGTVGGGGGSNDDRSWVDGPSAEGLDMNVVDLALRGGQGGIGVDSRTGSSLEGGLEELDIEEFVNLSGTEDGGGGDGASREGEKSGAVYM